MEITDTAKKNDSLFVHLTSQKGERGWVGEKTLCNHNTKRNNCCKEKASS